MEDARLRLQVGLFLLMLDVEFWYDLALRLGLFSFLEESPHALFSRFALHCNNV